MILYDVKRNKIIPIADYNLLGNRVRNPFFYSQSVDNQLLINVSDLHADYFREWFHSQHDSETGASAMPSQYKRDLYVITNKLEMYFVGTFIEDIVFGKDSSSNSLINVKFRSDYHEISHDRFKNPELKSLYRDSKINQILD